MQTQLIILISLGFVLAVILSFTHIHLHAALKRYLSSSKAEPVNKDSEIDNLKSEIELLKSRIQKLENSQV